MPTTLSPRVQLTPIPGDGPVKWALGLALTTTEIAKLMRVLSRLDCSDDTSGMVLILEGIWPRCMPWLPSDELVPGAYTIRQEFNCWQYDPDTYRFTPPAGEVLS